MTAHASGTFDVTLQPQPDDPLNDLPLKRLSLDKQCHGDLEAVSQGQMLTIGRIINTGLFELMLGI